MSKTSSMERNKKRARMIKEFSSRRARLKAVVKNQATSAEDRFVAVLKLAELPRNSSPNRYRNRCEVTGRSRGVYRKFKLGRIMLRDLASRGQIPGMVKSSW